ncbi:hypothetical protein GZ78_09305 [Endozoicomonas numazuensis]|uniref:Uncharacterized protein n=1 Tax=Endozoicomonas numazuensis TaxID=1137799 RepID=A0A081NHB8_9GAMM|nr:hypothetical protein GZ78_09305 [Endozoicomonas numazuensis]
MCQSRYALATSQLMFSCMKDSRRVVGASRQALWSDYDYVASKVMLLSIIIPTVILSKKVTVTEEDIITPHRESSIFI